MKYEALWKNGRPPSETHLKEEDEKISISDTNGRFFTFVRSNKKGEKEEYDISWSKVVLWKVHYEQRLKFEENFSKFKLIKKKTKTATIHSKNITEKHDDVMIKENELTNQLDACLMMRRRFIQTYAEIQVHDCC